VLAARVAAHDEADQLTRVEIGGAALWVSRLDKPVGTAVRVRVLARDVSLARDPPGRSSILNVLAARVEEVRDQGPDRVSVRLSLGAGPTGPQTRGALLARITRRSRDALGIAPGVTVYAMIKSVALVV
jgi:molybdate transport system ATP-binding protein